MKIHLDTKHFCTMFYGFCVTMPVIAAMKLRLIVEQNKSLTKSSNHCELYHIINRYKSGRTDYYSQSHIHKRLKQLTNQMLTTYIYVQARALYNNNTMLLYA